MPPKRAALQADMLAVLAATRAGHSISAGQRHEREAGAAGAQVRVRCWYTELVCCWCTLPPYLSSRAAIPTPRR